MTRVCVAHWRTWHRPHASIVAKKNALPAQSNWRRAQHGWMDKALGESTQESLRTPWILDADTSVKLLYGHQAGAEIGYNPTKPGRPSHTLHTYWIGNIRLVLDVEAVRALNV
ncbi:MAG: hypothetical protein U1D41_12095 [Nitrosomonas sp.]|uniref:hypothetical protein n=1 Tax=Nitrosomonas sp. TaxID=42353 RepID=UPI002735EE0B|nr:hypothetical protein [Nitrosomonas sp.]MDP3662092.1 hypothetical protein [Nitrosomonas sp.]MDZ4106879.1 hypothetical protein [Nitrosomonas sp.]